MNYPRWRCIASLAINWGIIKRLQHPVIVWTDGLWWSGISSATEASPPRQLSHLVLFAFLNSGQSDVFSLCSDQNCQSRPCLTAIMWQVKGWLHSSPLICHSVIHQSPTLPVCHWDATCRHWPACFIITPENYRLQLLIAAQSVFKLNISVIILCN